MTMTLQVRQRGTVTLPAAIRDRYNIQTGDSFRLVDLDGVLVLTPLTSPISANNASDMSSKSTELKSPKPRVSIDADVIFAGAAAPHTQGVSYIILGMSELTLLNGVTSEQAITKVTRNLAAKLPGKLPEFHLLVSRALHVVPDPTPEELSMYSGQADPKDLPLLVAALREACPYFVTCNTRHDFPTGKDIKIMRPGDLLLTIRQRLGQL
ncbi:MAG TPA: hypothetical protein PLH19_14450 [Anaerolineae bacterium]|nr:hypothetical protein [Anaerolineae bacterium]HQH39718.1 hypothetical protein [Anaerolineae bacterium]